MPKTSAWPTNQTQLNPVRETVEYDHSTDQLFIHKSQDVTQFLDDLKAERNANPTGFSKSGNWRKIGSIPMVLAERWYQEGFDCLDPNNAKEVRRRLNEFTKLRTVDKPV